MSESFEQRMQCLEDVIEQLQHPELPLEEMVTLYQRGWKLLDSLKETLNTAELTIRAMDEEHEGKEVEDEHAR